QFGKFGAQPLVRGLAGRRVRLRGALIYRDNQTMIEIEPGSLVETGMGSIPEQSVREWGEVRLVGEIVDSKCFLGVMNPGNLKTHKSCAIRCISGGIPPVLLVRGPRNE